MKNRVVAIIIARQGSSRLPGKALLKIMDRPILSLIVERLKKINLIDDICIATSSKKIDQPIIELAKKEKVLYYAGSPEDVLDRLYNAAVLSNAEIIYEVGGDCPFVDESTFKQGLELLKKNDYDFVHNFPPSTFPDGLDCPIMTIDCLKKMHRNAILKSNRMHPFSYIFTYPNKFKIGSFDYYDNAEDIRLTLDYQEDYNLIKTIFEKLYFKCKTFSLDDIVKLLRKDKKLIEINKKYIKELSPEPYWNTQAFINDLHTDLYHLAKNILQINNDGLLQHNIKNYDELIKITKILKKRSKFIKNI